MNFVLIFIMYDFGIVVKMCDWVIIEMWIMRFQWFEGGQCQNEGVLGEVQRWSEQVRRGLLFKVGGLI